MPVFAFEAMDNKGQKVKKEIEAGNREVAIEVESGSTLSDAFGKHPKIFDRLYVNMIKAGEAGGVLDTILERLAQFMEKSLRLKKKVIGALIYPVVVSTVAVCILAGIMKFVI